jgi:hypothetical protein
MEMKLPSLEALKVLLDVVKTLPTTAPRVEIATSRGIITKPALPIVSCANVRAVAGDDSILALLNAAK